MPIDGVEDLARDAFCFEQMTKLEDCRRVRRRLAVELDTDETSDSLAVVNHIFAAFVGKTITLLGNVHAEHTSKANRGQPGLVVLG